MVLSDFGDATSDALARVQQDIANAQKLQVFAVEATRRNRIASGISIAAAVFAIGLGVSIARKA